VRWSKSLGVLSSILTFYMSKFLPVNEKFPSKDTTA